MKYSWHRDYFKRTLKIIALIADQYIYQVDLDKLFDWFEETHPEVYKKFIALEAKMNDLWDQSGEKPMEQFKELCEQYEDTHRWAIAEFVKGVG